MSLTAKGADYEKTRSPSTKFRTEHPPRNTPAHLAAENNLPQHLIPASLQIARHRVSYIPGESPKEELAELPRLFIRGLGGSIKMDLGGLGLELSSQAEAFCMPDESLGHLGVHRGDIAIVQPPGYTLQIGDLLLVDLITQVTLRRAVKLKNIWYIEVPNRDGSGLLPLCEQPYQGIVVGILRLFHPVTPVKYRVPDSAYHPPREYGGPRTDHEERHDKVAKTSRRAPTYRIRKRAGKFLAAEKRKGVGSQKKIKEENLRPE